MYIYMYIQTRFAQIHHRAFFKKSRVLGGGLGAAEPPRDIACMIW